MPSSYSRPLPEINPFGHRARKYHVDPAGAILALLLQHIETELRIFLDGAARGRENLWADHCHDAKQIASRNPGTLLIRGLEPLDSAEKYLSLP